MLIFIVVECTQMYHNGFVNHLSDGYNLIDLFTFCVFESLYFEDNFLSFLDMDPQDGSTKEFVKEIKLIIMIMGCFKLMTFARVF